MPRSVSSLRSATASQVRTPMRSDRERRMFLVTSGGWADRRRTRRSAPSWCRRRCDDPRRPAFGNRGRTDTLLGWRGFAVDSPLEERGFEPSVPLAGTSRCLGVRPAEGKFVRTNFGRGVVAVNSVCCGRPPSEGLGAGLGCAGCRVARHAAAPPSGHTIIDSQARHSRIARTPAPDRQEVAL